MARRAGLGHPKPPSFLVQAKWSGRPPQRLPAADFQRLFAAAWECLPPGRRPQRSGCRRVAIDLHLVGDQKIAACNQEHLGHAGPTDVLSFPMLEFDPEREAVLLGEIVISFETAQREARARQLTLRNELLRYALHGFLHLVGYEDGRPAQARRMHALQERILAGLEQD